eukprot:4686056-Alexandrium_andersonii.AAC.1
MFAAARPASRAVSPPSNCCSPRPCWPSSSANSGAEASSSANSGAEASLGAAASSSARGGPPR